MRWLIVSLGCLLTSGPAVWGVDVPDPSLRNPGTIVTVAPQMATPSDEISVTVRRWVSYLIPAGSTVRTQGHTISVDVHWQQIYTLVAVPPRCAEYTVSLGKRSPGTYVVSVTNDGKPAGLAHFTVVNSVPQPSPTVWSLIERLRNALP